MTCPYRPPPDDALDGLAFDDLPASIAAGTFVDPSLPVPSARALYRQRLLEDPVADVAYTDEFLTAAHDHCSNNRAEIERSVVCGCFYCCKTFPPPDVKWIGEHTDPRDAVCPVCGIDSVIGDASGLAVTEAFLREMHLRWFDPDWKPQAT